MRRVFDGTDQQNPWWVEFPDDDGGLVLRFDPQVIQRCPCRHKIARTIKPVTKSGRHLERLFFENRDLRLLQPVHQ